GAERTSAKHGGAEASCRIPIWSCNLRSEGKGRWRRYLDKGQRRGDNVTYQVRVNSMIGKAKGNNEYCKCDNGVSERRYYRRRINPILTSTEDCYVSRNVQRISVSRSVNNRVLSRERCYHSISRIELSRHL